MTREKTGGHEKTTGEGSGKIRGQHTVVYIKEFTSEHTSVLQGPDASYNIQNILIDMFQACDKLRKKFYSSKRLALL